MLSPMDWALIESWKERGVPLHVALRGIEHAFDSFDAKKHKRTVKTLLYCQEEVEAQYAEWLESRVGGHEPAPNATSDDLSPFPRAAVVSYLDRSLTEISALAEIRSSQKDELAESLDRALALLTEIKSDYESSPRPDTRKLEESLTGVERLLDNAMNGAIGETEKLALQTEVESQLKPYRRQMDAPAFAQTRDNLLRKRIREHFGVPRLSLFFLQS